MAILVKPWVTRWVDAEGNRVPADTPGARQDKERARKWYAQDVPGWPHSKGVPLATHKATAQAMLNQLVREALQGAHGLTDLYAEHRHRPLSEHLDDFEAYLSAKDGTAKHVRQTVRRARAILAGCEFKRFEDLSGLLLAQWLAAERAADRLGPKTSNYYLRDFKAFVRWLMAQRRMATDPNHPCLKVEPVNAELDVRRSRRDLLPAELLALLDAAQASATTIHKLDGREPYHLYLTACGTGFRVSELASLTPESFRLDSRTPTATVQAKRAKNRKATTQPLPPGLVTILRPYLASKTPGERLWPSCWSTKAAELLQHDLGAVRDSRGFGRRKGGGRPVAVKPGKLVV